MYYIMLYTGHGDGPIRQTIIYYYYYYYYCYCYYYYYCYYHYYSHVYCIALHYTLRRTDRAADRGPIIANLLLHLYYYKIAADGGPIIITIYIIIVIFYCDGPIEPQMAVYILQRGVQWKQGVVIYTTLCTSLLYNATPIHCTPDPLHPPLQSIQGRQRRAADGSLVGIIYHIVFLCYVILHIYIYIYVYIYIYIYMCIYIYIYIYI